MYVIKVVDLVARIPEHLDLHFSDFSTILYGIYKFAVFANKRKRKGNLASRPLDFYFLLTVGPWSGFETGEAVVAGFRRLRRPAARGNRGRSKRRARGT